MSEIDELPHVQWAKDKQRIDALEKQLAAWVDEFGSYEPKESKAELDASRLRNKQLEADCAVMRNALSDIANDRAALTLRHPGMDRLATMAANALATDSGKALLAQLQAHRQALKEAKVALAGEPDERMKCIERISSVLGSKGDE